MVPKLILKFDDRVLKDYVVGQHAVTIGRLPDNTLVIDNPAVSGHHARVVRQGDHFVVEDLHSTNGTFVNEKRIIRQALQHDDVVLVGKHKLLFQHMADDSAADAKSGVVIPELGGTVVLDTKYHKELMAKLGLETQSKTATSVPATPKAAGPPPPRPHVGALHVVAGRADQSEYDLTAHTSIIGKSGTALVRLKGWLKPQAAVAIVRKDEGYAATSLRGKTLINGQLVRGRQDLHHGDVLQVYGLTLEFRLKR